MNDPYYAGSTTPMLGDITDNGTPFDSLRLSFLSPPNTPNNTIQTALINRSFFQGDLPSSELVDSMASTVPSILFVDAYDSFSQNIIALLNQELRANITVIKVDTIIDEEYNLSLAQFLPKFSAIVLGPGPGDPRDGGNFWPIIECAADLEIPVLGICLGFQAICMYYDLTVKRMQQPCHGHTKQIIVVDQEDRNEYKYNLFYKDIDHDDIWATCYNSLCVRADDDFVLSQQSRPGSSSATSPSSLASSPDSSSLIIETNVRTELEPQLKLLAKDEDGNAMAFAHRYLPTWGVQFHPESCKSNDACHQMLRNWLSMVNQHNKDQRSEQIFEYLPNAKISEEEDPSRNADEEQWSTNTILQELFQATESTGNTVQWRSTCTSRKRSEISEIINELCQNRSIAMLESTKKGRFSIYAVTEAWSKNVQSSQQSIVPSTSVFVEYRSSVASIRQVKGNQNVTAAALARRDDLMDALEQFMVSKRADGGAPEIPFWGGFIGYMSYENGLDAIRVEAAEHDRIVDDICLMWVDRSIIFDNETSTVYVQSIRENDQQFLNDVTDWFEITLSKAQESESERWPSTEALRTRLAFAFSKASTRITMPDPVEYSQNFDICQQQLHAGNSYELCLTTEAVVKISKTEEDGERYVYELYKNLHKFNPVPFGAFLNFPNTTILSTSPEQYMSWTRAGIIDMIPMKGTVKRTPTTTLAEATEILSSPKEQAENLMIADLIRHDLYTTIGPENKVEVIKLCSIVQHETVYQLVSHIRAHAPISASLPPSIKQKEVLRYGFSALKKTLPPGSMTGAPKKRSCELLHDIEARSRGVYSGVLGFLDVGGAGSWSVCIRTAFRAREETKDNVDTWHVGAGGAITVLSSKEGEWEEMKVKLKSVLTGFVE